MMLPGERPLTHFKLLITSVRKRRTLTVAFFFSAVRPYTKRPRKGNGHPTPSAAALFYLEVFFAFYSFSSGIYFASLPSMDLRSLLLAL